jgi:hypothetical protein
MIKLTYRNLAQTNLVTVLAKLTNMSVFDSKTAYRLHKINETVRKEYLKSMGEFNLLGVKYAQKDEKGNEKLDEKGFHIPVEGQEEDYKAAFVKLLETEFEIKQHKVDIDALTVRLSPSDMASLEPIVEGLDDES